MPTPSKFTADRRKLLIEGAELGLSRQSNSIHAGIEDATLRRWLERGRIAPEGSAFKRFREEFLAAEVAPRKKALAIVSEAWPDKPDLAWKFIERREPGYAPPMPNAPVHQGPVVIELKLAGGQPLAMAAADIIEGEVIELADGAADADLPAEA
jgi:hypothetical protein